MQDIAEFITDHSQPFQPESTQSLEINRFHLLGRLIPNLVHELNNPLQAISGSTTLALEDLNNSEEVAAYLDVIQRETQRSIMLLQLFRQLYRPLNSRPQPINVIELLSQLSPILKDSLNRNSLSVHIEIPPAPVVILAAEPAIQLALINALIVITELLPQSNRKEFSISIGQRERNGCIEIALPQDEKLCNAVHDLSPFLFTRDLVKTMGGEFLYEKRPQDYLLSLNLPLTGKEAGNAN
jgi:C4-dicarboxylate-specific signal transduction histidine kinase